MQSKTIFIMRIFRHYLFIILFLVFLPSVAQKNYSVQTLGTTEGITSPVSFGVTKDSHGFIWVATRLGVDRFDGLQFKHYSMSKSGMRMADDGVRHDLLQNADGEIFVYSDLGKIFRYDEEGDTFEQLFHFKSLLGGHSLHAFAIEENQIILGLFDGITLLDRSTQSISSKLCEGNNIRCIIPFANNTYLVGSEHGLLCLDLAQNSCEQIACPNLDIMSLYYDTEQKMIWMGTKGKGLWVLQLSQMEAIQIKNFEQVIVSSISPYADSQLLVGTDGSGLLSTSRLFISPLQMLAGTLPEAPNTLPSAAIQNVFVDNNHIWLATYDCGLILLSPNPLLDALSLPQTDFLSNRYCYDLGLANDGSIWAAYNRSICQYSNTLSEPKTFLEDKASFLAIEVTEDGMVWCGGYNSGLFRLNPKTGKVDHIPSLTDAGVNSSVYDILEDKNGNLWVGGHNIPLFCIRIKDGKFPTKEDMIQYDITRVGDIEQLNDSCIMVGAVNGFFIVNTETNEVTHLLAENDHFGWEGTNFVSCLSVKDNNTLYIGTDGAGLLSYNLETQELKSFSANSHNLPSNFIRAIEQSNDSMLWISTESTGIFSFDIKNEKVRHRLSSTSLQTNECFMHASVKMPNGDILFGGKGGVEQIIVSSLKDINPNISIFLSEVGIGQENRISFKTHPEVLKDPIMSVEKVSLPYGEKSLRLQFTTDDLYNQGDHLLVYRLDDQSEWEKMNVTRELTFYSLSPGTHNLYVRCIMSNGQFVEKHFIIDAQLSPWLQWPAKILYLFLLIVFILAIISFYQKQMENSAAEEKISFFSHVAHDIRTPLSLVSAPISDLEKYISPNAPSNLLPVIKHNLQHLTDVVNQLSLFNSNHQNIQKLDSKAIPLCKLAKTYSEAYQPLAKHLNLSLELDVPEQELWVMADEKAFGRIIDNVLGNAFKFTKQGGIKILVRNRGKYGIIEIQDTGIGMSDTTRKKLFRHFFRGDNAIDENVSGFGLGMMYSYQTIKKLGGRISCQSQEGKGSTFFISMPLTEAKPSEDNYIEQNIPIKETAILDTRLLYSGYRHDILLVEDSQEMRDYLASKLSVGYNVSLASNVAEAKAYLQGHSADLIISDIIMPGERGDDWCKELKANFETAHIPVILLTANSDFEDQLQGLSIGADEYITKPFDINILLMKIRNIFESRHRLHAYYVETMELKPREKSANKKAIDKEEVSTQRDLDDQFLSQLMTLIDKYISDPDLSIEDLAKDMAMSHTLFYEKINKLVGMPPASLVRNCRMKRAKELLLEGRHSVSEIASLCGFADAKYFSTAFKKFYGCPPSKITDNS